MKHFLIRYLFKNGSREDWHRHLHQFIAWLDGEPELKGLIAYRCMKERDGDAYYHLATAADEQAIKLLQSKEFFKRYTEATREAAGGEVEVLPLELIAATA